MTTAGKAVRCAIYTRVSTDSGLDQEFNSLDAQYDAASAYVRSQAHAHWTLIRARYDDGGFSGGSTDRPALQRLLDDVRGRRINVIVVYKVDRLTRSLADFAKLVELFDAHGVSFVSVTQQFNTTTSMGRLTLNVLLSFAQFEREVTSERIRDKIAASKRKGLWVGGMVPLGYELKDGKLLIIETQAEQVRTIFRRYLELGSVNPLVVDLRERGFRTKIRRLSNGRTTGGVAFTQGPLFYMLRNRFYVGEVRYKNEIFPGPQPPLMERELFEAVQAKLTAQWSHRTVTRTRSACLLAGLLFDDAGHRMVPTHATKNRVRYRYYVSEARLRGDAEASAGSISRVPASEIEAAVIKALTMHLGDRPKPTTDANRMHREIVTANVVRIEVRKNQLAVRLKRPNADAAMDRDQAVGVDPTGSNKDESGSLLLIPWCKPPSKKFREILLPPSVSRREIRPIKAERRAALIKSIARGRDWLDQIVSGRVQAVEQITARHKCSHRHVNMTISMAFIAPALVKAAVEGRLPRGIGVGRLRDAPAEWSHQLKRLGLAQRP
jgi:DNA invertase Pin-like site-specific DNA recombinase